VLQMVSKQGSAIIGHDLSLTFLIVI